MRAAIVAPTFVLTLAGYASFGDAQTTAGSGTTVVFPVTAQTASFVSEVTLFNPGPSLLTGRRATSSTCGRSSRRPAVAVPT